MSPKGRGIYRIVENVETYRYNAVFTVEVWRKLQEVAVARNQTIIMTLTSFIHDGYARWWAEQRSNKAKGR